MFSHSKAKLLSSTTTTGAGKPIQVGLKKTLRVDVWGTGSFTVQIEGVGESGVYRPLQIWDIPGNGYTANSTINGAGFYEVDIQGFNSFRANVKSITGGNVSASGVLL